MAAETENSPRPLQQLARQTRRRRVIRFAGWAVALVVVIAALLTGAAAGYDAATTGTRATIPPLDAHGHEVRTGDIVTRYETWGRRGPVIVLVPGFIESSFVWRRVGPLLGRQFRVFALDIRGFGYTTHRGPYTLAADTRQVAEFLHVLRLDAVHHAAPLLVGHSSGAAIVANVALRQPRLARGIVMLDGDGTSSGAGPAWMHALIVDPFFTAVLRFVLRHPFITRGVWSRVCGPRCPPFAGNELQGWQRPLEVPGAEAALRAIVQAPLIGLAPALLERIHLPAAVMLGTRDPTISVARARASAGWLHTRIVVTVPQARHLPMISNPNEFSRDLASIVHELPGGRTGAR
ncbi:MAG: alpha/beta hydrolase [Chloroflexota bacterium]|nr:alpha/beta hydrolase [Chloroflexota bacterium]